MLLDQASCCVTFQVNLTFRVGCLGKVSSLSGREAILFTVRKFLTYNAAEQIAAEGDALTSTINAASTAACSVVFKSELASVE